MNKVYVTGMGVISAIGNNLSENLSLLQNSISGIGKASLFQSKYSKTHVFGEVHKKTLSLRDQLNIYDKDFTRTDLLAFVAFNEAINNANISQEELSSESMAFISASTIGGMIMTEQLHSDANLKSTKSDYLESYSSYTHAQKFAQKYKLCGIIDVINTACSSSANAIMMGARLIKSGRVEKAIVGGTDSLGKFSVNGFNALQIMSKTPCKPFDENRIGLNLGEGAAYLVLESSNTIGSKKKYAEILGYGNSNDAYHTSSLSDEAFGVILAMKKALSNASIKPAEIDYINTHGTATANNDYTELTGIKSVFDYLPRFNSTKSYTGHTLAAAGAVEAIFSILSINNNELYSSLNFEQPIIPFKESPIVEYQSGCVIDKVMTNSFGFAGNCTSLIIGQP